jgi:Tfp pilus assembly protein PilN
VTGKHWWQRTRVPIIERPLLDFRPTEFRPRPFPVQATLTASLVGVLMLGMGGLFQLVNIQENSVAQAQEQLVELERSNGLKRLRVNRAVEQRAEITRLQDQTEALIAKIDQVRDRERGFARVINLLRAETAVVAGVNILQIDDDGKQLSVALSASDYNSILEYVRRLEAQPGFTSVKVRTVTMQQTVTEDGTAGETGGAVSDPFNPLTPGGPVMAAPGEAGEGEATASAVTVTLRIERTPQLEPPVTPTPVPVS